MRIRRPVALGLVILALLLGCAGSGQGNKPAGASLGGRRLALNLVPGEHYQATTTWLIFKLPIYPQVAVWLETPQGRYLGTLYVTGKTEKASFVGAPKEGRPESLPVWSHLKSSQGSDVDSVSAPTSPGTTRRESQLAADLPPGDYVVKLETNRSYDYNEAYPRETAGVCGQPSLVYGARLHIGEGPATATFRPLGLGSLDGSDGAVHEGLGGITTALALFSALEVSYLE